MIKQRRRQKEGRRRMDKVEANKAVLGDELFAMCKLAATPVASQGLGQAHLFVHWPAPGEEDEKKVKMAEQLAALDRHYPNGMVTYVTNAKKLLHDSKAGVNPFKGFVPEVPVGERLQIGTELFNECEKLGVGEAERMCFVLVAGGLGERLGYNGIKVALPVEIVTGRCFLQLYCEHILALQHRARETSGKSDIIVPLAIMTSADTHAKTLELLRTHSNFGMAEEQITLIKQELVPALTDFDCRFGQSEEDPYTVGI